MKIKEKKVTLKSGKELILRSPSRDDAQAMMDFVSAMSEEAPYILLGPGEFKMTLEQEADWINTHNEATRGVLITSWINNKLVGITNASTSSRKKYQHVAHLGTSVAKDFRGQGIGKLALSELIDWATTHPEIEILQLSVMGQNATAISLYEKLKFEKCGEVPNAFKVNNEYNSEVIMSRSVIN